jgi:hypothetical protein
MSVHLLKNFDIQKIRFNDIIKKKKMVVNKQLGGNKEVTVHTIDIYYNNAPLFIQLDSCVCRGLDDNKCMILEISKKTEDYIKSIEEFVVESVHKKSKKWFNGRRFTFDKIQNGLVPCVSRGTAIIIVNDDSSLYDQYKKSLNFNDCTFPLECTCIVRICGLQFIENKFSCKISLEQCRINMEYKLAEYSIIDNDSKTINQTSITETLSEHSYREYPEYYNSDKESEQDFFPQ